MKRMTLEEIKQEEYRTLKEFASFCKVNNLTYSLAGGTLLGAVRHQGFIPWDDDIDVFMPRDDYEKFLMMYKDTDEFCCLSYKYSKGYYYPFAKLCSKRTYVYEERLQEKYRHNELGAWIDIFPVDWLDKPDSKWLWFKHECLMRMIGTRRSSYKKSDKLWKRIMKPFYYYLLKMIPIRWLVEAMDMQARGVKNDQGMMAQICWNNKVIHASLWNTLRLWKFEDSEFMGFGDDEYLRKMYGDYMKLPPEDQRVGGHMIGFWRD